MRAEGLELEGFWVLQSKIEGFERNGKEDIERGTEEDGECREERLRHRSTSTHFQCHGLLPQHHEISRYSHTHLYSYAHLKP